MTHVASKQFNRRNADIIVKDSFSTVDHRRELPIKNGNNHERLLILFCYQFVHVCSGDFSENTRPVRIAGVSEKAQLFGGRCVRKTHSLCNCPFNAIEGFYMRIWRVVIL